MALPADFSKIFGSTATGGLTPIGDVNYAKGWEFVGANPPTKNDFSYLQNLSDLKSQWLYSNKLQRTNPFGDIKADGSAAVARSNLDLGTAATKNVGTGTGQIPDMSAFTSGPGWVRFPNGTTIQYGSTGFAPGVNNQYVTLPRAFSSADFTVATTWNDVSVSLGGGAQASADIGVGTGSKTTTRFGLWQGGAGGFNVDWIAIGVS